MTSANSRLLLLGGLGLSFGGALTLFTITIGQGRLTGPGVFLAGSVGTLGVVAYLLVRTAQALVETGAAAQAREEKAATGRRRKELEREYNTLKRALKELELDYTMGKISEQDYTEIRGRYRERAVRVLRQLDQGESYRAQIERDLQARRQAKGLPKKAQDSQATAATGSTSTLTSTSSSVAATPAASPSATSAEPTAVTAVPTDASAETPKKGGAGRAGDKDSLSLPPGYEPSIISEEPTKAASGFSAAAAAGKAKVEVQRDGLNFSDSATVMRAVAKLTGGNTVSSELTQSEPTQQTAVPALAAQSSGPSTVQGLVPPGPVPCASCAAINDADANFCKKCGARLHS